jgi:hypothetical protein
MAPPDTRKGVHFDLASSPGSLPDLSSFDDASLTSQDSSGIMPFVNAQLLAHGFTHGSGLDTEGLGAESVTKLSKCLMSMLGQRTVRAMNGERRRKRVEWEPVGRHEACRRLDNQVSDSLI